MESRSDPVPAQSVHAAQVEGGDSARAQASDATDAAQRRPHWRQLLSGSSSREVLARIHPGDPLELRRLAGERLRERAWLCDADRVFVRAVARCARFAVRYRGQPELKTWLGERVDEALADLLREDLEAERAGQPPEPEASAAYEDLARPLGLPPAAMRGVCVAFNQLPEAERKAFFALVIESRSLDELARASGEPAPEIARRARRALDAVLLAGAAKEPLR
jgi:DNA-directed RNA polymerase specialized sigma24 family protein